MPRRPQKDAMSAAKLEQRLVLKDGTPAIAVEPVFETRLFAEGAR